MYNGCDYEDKHRACMLSWCDPYINYKTQRQNDISIDEDDNDNDDDSNSNVKMNTNLWPPTLSSPVFRLKMYSLFFGQLWHAYIITHWDLIIHERKNQLLPLESHAEHINRFIVPQSTHTHIAAMSFCPNFPSRASPVSFLHDIKCPISFSDPNLRVFFRF